MVAEAGRLALILAFLIALVLATVVLTILLIRRYDARRARVPAPPPAGWLNARTLAPLALGLALVFVLAASAYYLRIGRPSDAPAPAQALPSGHPEVDPAAVIGDLQARLKAAPNDPEGWRMLGWSFLQVGRNAEAAQAYGKAAALDPHNAEYRSAEGEATVLASGGQVTPAAEAAFRQAVQIDPADPRARYYLALARDQRGDQTGAMDDWIALLRSAPPDAPWAPQVRAFVEKVAAARGVDLAARLPPASRASEPGLGPTPDQVAAARNMSPGDQQAMIAGMVARLADRLQKNPRDRDGWERLMRARMVLGQPAAAAQAYRDGRRAFAGSPGDQAGLRQAAASLGVPGI